MKSRASRSRLPSCQPTLLKSVWSGKSGNACLHGAVAVTQAAGHIAPGSRSSTRCAFGTSRFWVQHLECTGVVHLPLLPFRFLQHRAPQPRPVRPRRPGRRPPDVLDQRVAPPRRLGVLGPLLYRPVVRYLRGSRLLRHARERPAHSLRATCRRVPSRPAPPRTPRCRLRRARRRYLRRAQLRVVLLSSVPRLPPGTAPTVVAGRDAS